MVSVDSTFVPESSGDTMEVALRGGVAMSSVVGLEPTAQDGGPERMRRTCGIETRRGAGRTLSNTIGSFALFGAKAGAVDCATEADSEFIRGQTCAKCVLPNARLARTRGITGDEI